MTHGTLVPVIHAFPPRASAVRPGGWFLVALGILGATDRAGGAESTRPVLTNFNQVLSLGLGGARETAHPVRVRGVVVFPSWGNRELVYLHDGTNGLGVGLLTVAGLGLPISAQPKVGDWVEVEGETTAGSSHPFVGNARVQLLGPGHFSSPQSIRGRDLGAGHHHGQLVTLRAVVLDVSRTRDRVELVLNADGVSFLAAIGEPSNRLPVEWLNATVDLQGMPWMQFDSASRPTRIRMLVTSNSWLRIVRPGSSNLFAGPRLSIAGVSNAPVADDRFVVSGVVSYAWPNHFVAVEDATGAAIAYPLQLSRPSRESEALPRLSPELHPGDRIEIVASKHSRRPFSPVLANSEYHVVGSGTLPPPPQITEGEALTGAHDCRRVRITGQVVDRDWYDQYGSKVSRMHLKLGNLITTAVYAGNKREVFAAPTGSRVELTGLCVISAGTDRPVRNFSLFLSSPDDVRVLPEPPLWQNPAVLQMLGVVGSIAGLALGWVWLLRRQVAARTSELRGANRRLEAEVTERTRAEADLAARVKLLALNAGLAEALNETSDLQPMLQRCADELVRYLDAAFARVWTLNETSQTLELQASAGLYTHLNGPHGRIPVGQYKIGLIAREKTPHLTNDVPNDPRISDPDWARREGMVSFAGYPLVLEGRVLGVVAVFARTPIGPETLQALGSAAYSLALGVERKRAEGELRRALERERELGELKTNFVSMVSHEFRTPLEIIVSSADILERYLDRLPVEDRAEHLRAIQGSVKRMSGMMEDVLLLGRLESARQPFRPDDIRLNACCRRVSEEIRSATGGRCPFELDLDNTLPLARADEHLLRHILTNLLSNAVKYSPAGAPVRLSLRRDGVDAVLRVEDTGLGIPAADQARLFEAFYRGRNTNRIPGTGLGLVIVKRSVELHGGRIEFASEEGRGTRFTVRLPAFQESPTEP